MSFLQRLLDPQHLFDPAPGPPSGLYLVAFLALGLALLGATAALLVVERRRAWWWRVEALLCAVGALLVASRLLGLPILSTRALLLADLVLVALPPAAALARTAWRRGWVLAQLRLLALCPGPDDAALPWPISLFLLTAHLAGLALVYRFLGQPYTLALPLALASLLALAMPLVISALLDRRSPLSTFALVLTPLFLLYAIVLTHRVVFVLLGRIPPIVQPFTLPDLGMAFFNLEADVWAVLAYVLLMEAAAVLAAWGRRRWLVPGAALVLLAGTVLWTTVDYATHHAAGVTAGDPYGYAQMAVDMATQGHPIHAFRLPTLVADLPIDPEPTTPIGYTLVDDAGHAISVWPFGGAIPIALGYLLLGERGLYLATPAVGLVSLLATAALAWEVTRGWSRSSRLLATAVAVFLLGTSYEQIDRLLVPMGDAAAQLATTLFFLFVLRGARTGRLRDATLAGATLGLAYLVRHTQVVLLPLVVVPAWGAPTRRARARNVAAAGLAALVVAVPDLVYHWVAFGNPFQPEQSGELAAFALGNVPGGLGLLAGAFLSQHEFGYVLPFLLAGVWVAFRERRRVLGILLVGVAILVAVHVPYYFVKVRDLLSVFPVAAVLTGYGLAAAFLWLARRQSGAKIEFGSRGEAREARAPTGQGHLRSSQPRASAPRGMKIHTETGHCEPPQAAKQSPHGKWGLLRFARNDGGERGYLRERGETTTLFFRAGLVALALFTLSARTWLMKPLRPHWAGYGGLTPVQRAAFDELAVHTPADAAVGSSLNGGPIALYSQRMTYRPGTWSEAEFGVFCQGLFQQGVPVYLLHDGAEVHDALRYAQAHYRLTPVAWLEVPLFSERDQATGVLYRLAPAQ